MWSDADANGGWGNYYGNNYGYYGGYDSGYSGGATLIAKVLNTTPTMCQHSLYDALHRCQLIVHFPTAHPIIRGSPGL